MNYTNYTTEQLIARLQELEVENAQLKADLLEERKGYIYIVQFSNDVKDGVFKAGKTGKNIENRFANYRSVFGEKLGNLNIKRVAAVSDSLAAEQYMHELIRKSGVQSINDTERNKKSSTKSEWYIDNNMERIEKAFDKAANKFALDDERAKLAGTECLDIVKKYDTYAKDELNERLIPIDHYKNYTLQPNTYYFDKDSKKVYKQTTHGLDEMTTRKSTGKYGMNKEGSGTCSVSLDYIVSEYK